MNENLKNPLRNSLKDKYVCGLPWVIFCGGVGGGGGENERPLFISAILAVLVLFINCI